MFMLRKLFAPLVAMVIALVMMPRDAWAETVVDPAEPDCLDVSISLSPAHPELLGGGQITITAEARSNVDPQPHGTLRISVLGKIYSFHSNTGTITITTPVVTHKTTANISASYIPDDGGTSKTCYLDPVDARGVMTLLSADDSALPNTGGPGLWYLVSGALLLVLGGLVLGGAHSRPRARHL